MAVRNQQRELPAGTYAFSIEKWSYRYSFGATNAKESPRNAYVDNAELLVVGTLTHPRRSIGRKIKVTFWAKKSPEGRSCRVLSRKCRLVHLEPKRKGVLWFTDYR